MKTIELEISFDDDEVLAHHVRSQIMNGDSFVGRKHGKWFLFITCSADRIGFLGQELYYALM